VAADPLIAMQKIGIRRPDVILLDIEMPRMNGLTFLDRIMAEDPIPVVICSAVAGRDSENAFRALRNGAVDVVAKPKVGVREFLTESRVLLVDALRAASAARLNRVQAAAPLDAQTPLRGIPAAGGSDRVVALGASTGGTQALRVILTSLPKDAPPIVIVQHMPEVFTAHFARHLDRECAMKVKEAADGDRLQRGLVLLAPGNRHMRVMRERGLYSVALDSGPLVTRHRPSVDVLFESVAQSAGPAAVGALLTGMGADGADGLKAMKRAGAATIAQNERTSVVFGMPKEAIARGAVDFVLPLTEIAGVIARLCAEGSEWPRAIVNPAPL
jgi:two-component system chemotaxis response regulator CheB